MPSPFDAPDSVPGTQPSVPHDAVVACALGGRPAASFWFWFVKLSRTTPVFVIGAYVSTVKSAPRFGTECPLVARSPEVDANRRTLPGGSWNSGTNLITEI